MLPANPGGHAAYQDTFVSDLLKFYPDPFVLSKSTWDYIVLFWYLDLSQTDSIIDVYKRQLRINTLDYKLYQGIQQKIIDTLDKAEYVHIKGCGANNTDLRVALHKLENPAEETNFENCVADVNIPVGEVFTSPVLKGTDGILHVTRVYLNGLKYLNLEIEFKDGMIADYSCTNFETSEENKKDVYKRQIIAGQLKEAVSGQSLCSVHC